MAAYIIPETIQRAFRPATSVEIRSWSFGAVSRRCEGDLADWSDRKGTLDDEAIFGPTTDYRCACGKHSVEQVPEWMICDICGVRITTTRVRRERFGHIILRTPLDHNLAEPSTTIEAFPVLPAAIRESKPEGVLNDLYERMLEADECADGGLMREAYESICLEIVPAMLFAMDWSMPDMHLFGMGLAIVPRTAGPRKGDILL